MYTLTTIHELKSTLADARIHGDPLGHLRALWQTIRIPDPDAAIPNTQSPILNTQPIQPGLSVIVHGIPGHVLYPAGVPGYWAVAHPNRLNRSVHERDMVVL